MRNPDAVPSPYETLSAVAVIVVQVELASLNKLFAQPVQFDKGINIHYQGLTTNAYCCPCIKDERHLLVATPQFQITQVMGIVKIRKRQDKFV